MGHYLVYPRYWGSVLTNDRLREGVNQQSNPWCVDAAQGFEGANGC